MSMTDPIADFLTRIRNAIHANHRKVDIPSSNLKKEIARVLQEQSYIQNFINIDDNKQGILRIYLKYNEDNDCVITGLRRVSRPGLRKYVGTKEIPRVLNNLGISIMSTPNGVMTGLEARRKGVGGEVLCYVW
jgi:small subunit ribosomal protein S8